MAKKDRPFTSSKEWLDWLAEAPAGDKRSEAHDVLENPVVKSPSLSSSLRRTAVPQFSAPSRQYINSRRKLDFRKTSTAPGSLAASVSQFSHVGASLRKSSTAAPGRLRAGKTGSLRLDPAVFRARADSGPAEPIASIESTKHHQKTDVITLNFHIPTAQLAKLRVHFGRRKIMIILAICLVVVVVIFVPPVVIKKLAKHSSDMVAQSSADSQPSFAPLVPTNSDTQTVSKPQYNEAKKIYQFQDTYRGVAVVISEQPLPDNLKADLTKLKPIATSIGATDSVDTVDGKLYISPSDKATSQRLVYASKQLLIFITASGVLKDSDWVEYVQNLSS